MSEVRERSLFTGGGVGAKFSQLDKSPLVGLTKLSIQSVFSEEPV